MSDYPETDALETWEADGVGCSIVRQKSGHLCGYARFPSRPVREMGYRGILSYVPVHGGITYAEEHEDGTMVYGFDCSHSGDVPPLELDKYPQYRDPAGHVWVESEVREETERMVVAIRAAVSFEERYLLAHSGAERAEVLDEYHTGLAERGIPFALGDNFGAMIGVLGGLSE